MPTKKKTTTNRAVKKAPVRKKRTTVKGGSRPALSSSRRGRPASAKAPARQGKIVKVNVAKTSLDTYRSPHRLDLSKIKRIEHVEPPVNDSKSLYDGLPAGEFLSKFHILEFFSFKESEVLNFIKVAYRQFVRTFILPFRRVDISPKLPLMPKKFSTEKHLLLWQEVSLVNLFNFIVESSTRLGEMVDSALIASGRGVYQKLESAKAQYEKNKDEIVEFRDETKSTIIKYHSKKKPIKVEVKQKRVDKIKIDFGYFYGLVEVLKKIKLPKISLPRVELPKIELPKPKVSKVKQFRPHWPERLSFGRLSFGGAIVIVVAMMFIAVPDYLNRIQQTRGLVLGEAENAIVNLGLAQSQLAALEFDGAQEYIINAQGHFVSAQNQLDEIRSFLTVMAGKSPFGNTYKSGKNLLELGEHLSIAGQHLVSGLSEMSSESSLSITSRAKNFQSEVNSALSELKMARSNLDNVKSRHLPKENKDEFEKLRQTLPLFIQGLEELDRTADFAINFLGDNDLRRYLLVFQNDNELRATGGFMGSYALLDIKSGQIENIEIPGGGTYDVRAGANHLIKSPEPMQLVNPRWEFQDANWWPSWPKSAENISWFYGKSGGPTVDGVIAVNSDWLGNLLSVIGPIDLPDYAKTITMANFEDELQKEVEIEYADERTPKKILGDIAPEIIDRVLNIPPTGVLDLLSIINDGLSQRDILMYFDDDELESFVSSQGWAGDLKDSKSDFLSVVNTNIAGGKTDNVVIQDIGHQAEILGDGTIIDTLIVKRYHYGPIEGDFTDFPNRSYMRFYVPLGSKLISANGFISPLLEEFRKVEDYLTDDERLVIENNADIDVSSNTRIYTEDGKTVFANWLVTSPGQTNEIVVKYKLPFKLDLTKEMPEGMLDKIKDSIWPDQSNASYSLLIQKQSGSGTDNVVSHVTYPSKLNRELSYPDAYDENSNEIIYKGELEQDLLYFTNFTF